MDPITVRTAGDLWKAEEEGRAISPESERVVASIFDDQGHGQMKRLIAAVAIYNQLDRADVINMPINQFVEHIQAGRFYRPTGPTG